MKTLVRSSSLGIAWWVSNRCRSSGQTIERDTTITGPRGNSIERQVEIKRTPGSIERQVQIKRPGGTFERQVQVQRSGAGGVRRGPLDRGTMAAAAVDTAYGRDWSARAGVRIRIAGGPRAQFFVRRRWHGSVRWGRADRGAARGPAPPPDEVALMTQRLQSFYWNNRKEAAYTLGTAGRSSCRALVDPCSQV